MSFDRIRLKRWQGMESSALSVNVESSCILKMCIKKEKNIMENVQMDITKN